MTDEHNLPPDLERLIEEGVADQSIFTPANRDPVVEGRNIRLTRLDEDGNPTGDPIPFTATHVAAGGWCAPSETVYALGDDTSLEPGSLLNAQGDVVTSPVPTVREKLAGHTRRAALWAGTAEPTTEERQIVADVLYQQEVMENRAWFDTGVFLEKVKALEFHGLEREILELHQRVGASCVVCDDEDSEQWPCETVRLVLARTRVEIPEELVYEKPKPVLQDHDNPRWPFPSGPVDVLGRIDIPQVSVQRGGLRYDTGPLFQPPTQES